VIGRFRSTAMPAPVPMRAASGAPSPASLWPLLCSAVLVAIMLASEIARVYRAQSSVPRRPATGAFGTARKSDEPRAVQHKRTHELGWGRHAETPWQIPWKGRKDILWRTYEQIGEDRLLAVAGRRGFL
jgi:membrane protein